MLTFSHFLQSTYTVLFVLGAVLLIVMVQTLSLVKSWFGPAPRVAAVVLAGPLPLPEARQAYYRQARGLTPSLMEYLRWFNTLPAVVRPAARLAGPQEAWKKRAFRCSFRRFVLEHRGYNYVEFMADHLEPAQFQRWVNLLNMAAPEGQAAHFPSCPPIKHAGY